MSDLSGESDTDDQSNTIFNKLTTPNHRKRCISSSSSSSSSSNSNSDASSSKDEKKHRKLKHPSKLLKSSKSPSTKSISKNRALSLSTLYSSDESSSESSSANSLHVEDKITLTSKPIEHVVSSTSTVSSASVSSSTLISKTSTFSKCSVTSLTSTPNKSSKSSHSSSCDKTLSRPSCKPSSKFSDIVDENQANRTKQVNSVKRPDAHKKTILIPPTPLVRDRTKSQDSKHSSSSSKDGKSQNKEMSKNKESSSTVLGKRANASRSNSDSSSCKRERNESSRSEHKVSKPSPSLLSSTLSSSMKIKAKPASSISNKLLDLPGKPKTCAFLPSSQRVDRPKKHTSERNFVLDKKDDKKHDVYAMEKIDSVKIESSEFNKQINKDKDLEVNNIIKQEPIKDIYTKESPVIENAKVIAEISQLDIKIENIKIENIKVEDKKVEDKKVEEKKVEEKKVEDKKVEDKKVEDKKVEDKKVEDKKVEYKKVEDENIEVVKSEVNKKEDDSDEDLFFTTLKIDVKPVLDLTPPTTPAITTSKSLQSSDLSPNLMEKPQVKIAIDSSPSETERAVEQSLVAIAVSVDAKVEVDYLPRIYLYLY